MLAGSDLLAIMVIALIVFGPKKLPEIGQSIGKAMREFRKASEEAREGFGGRLKAPGDGETPPVRYAKAAVKALFLTLLVTLAGYLFIRYNLYSQLTDPRKAIQFINSFHPYDDFVFIAIQIFQVLIAGALPAEITGVVGGYLYGPILGTIYSTVGLGIGSCLAFGLARVYGLACVRRVVRASIIQKYDHFMRRRGSFVSFILFLIPGAPKAAFCYIVGLSQMNLRTFVAVSTTGRLLGTFLLSVTGSSIRDNKGVTLFIVFAIAGVFFLTVYLNRGRLMKMEETLNRRRKKTMT